MKYLLTALVVACAALFVAAQQADPAAPPDVDAMRTLPGDLGALPLPPAHLSADHAAKIALGRRLFFDTRLSLDHSMSCATCHDPEKGFTDALRLSPGFGGKALRRHSPTVLNAVHNVVQFWDGRAKDLAEQATLPIMSGDEMNMGSEERVIERLTSDPDYRKSFQELYGVRPNLKLVGDAIAAYEATLVTPDSPFDRYMRGEKSALSEAQKRGLALFVGKASCTQCHTGLNFTDNGFHNLGVGTSGADQGRFEVTKDPADRGKFKTPTLRNVSITAPYMHDGSVATLEEVVDFYNKGGGDAEGKSELMFELDLTAQEQKDLVAFLKSLTGTVPK
jgi:cytochrome c peroxidase